MCYNLLSIIIGPDFFLMMNDVSTLHDSVSLLFSIKNSMEDGFVLEIFIFFREKKTYCSLIYTTEQPLRQ